MGSSYGKNLKLTIFGQSHSPAIGMTLEGLPAGILIDMEKLRKFMKRRAPGQGSWSTTRREEDRPEFLSGLVDNVTCGAPLTGIIRNTNTRSGDYDAFRYTPRPGHGDYTGEIRYDGFQDFAGGGHFSGRLTAPLCMAGGIVKQILEREGIHVIACIRSIGQVKDEGELMETTEDKVLPVVTKEAEAGMITAIEAAKKRGDSLGGVIECKVTGVPAGIGDPIFDGIENRIAAIVFGIPAIKGIEFGLGFGCAVVPGSINNDAFRVEEGRIVTETNHAGGILGGITNGMPISFRVAVKPTPSIAMEQNSVNLKTMENAIVSIRGRHDPCIVPRAVPCVEAAAAIAVYDALLEHDSKAGMHR